FAGHKFSIRILPLLPLGVVDCVLAIATPVGTGSNTTRILVKPGSEGATPSNVTWPVIVDPGWMVRVMFSMFSLPTSTIVIAISGMGGGGGGTPGAGGRCGGGAPSGYRGEDRE